jgi:hypothetical protein
MPRSRAPSIAPGTFFVAQPWVDCITNMPGFNLRQAHLPPEAERPQFDVMVVAGDLIPKMERGALWLLEHVPDKPIIYIAGNHEGYGADVDRTVEKAMKIAEGTKLFVLQNRQITLGDVVFVGATRWTDFDLFKDRRRAMDVAGERMNDFKKSGPNATSSASSRGTRSRGTWSHVHSLRPRCASRVTTSGW